MSSGFAILIRSLMEQHGISLRGLARRIPVDPGQLSRILNGRRPPNEVIARSCDAVFGTGDLLTQAARADRLTSGRGPASITSPTCPWSDDGPGAHLGPQLLEAYQALAGGQPSAMALDGVEAMVTWLHHRYATLPAGVLMPQLVGQTRLLILALQSPLRIADRVRICAALGEIAGLRGWLLFDLGDLLASSAWFALAHRAADEAGAQDLSSWLHGAQSLQPSYAGHHRTALDLLERGIAGLTDPAGSRTGGWLLASAARSYAAVGDCHAFRAAWDAATASADVGAVRHGMDLTDDRLDLGYYGGGALLALRRPAQARELLGPSLEALPATRLRARSVRGLTLAASHAQEGDDEHATHLALEALSLPADQCIDPILRRVGDVRGELARLDSRRHLKRLDEKLSDVAPQAHPASSPDPSG